MAKTKSELIAEAEALGYELAGNETVADLMSLLDQTEKEAVAAPGVDMAALLKSQQAMMQQMADALTMLAASGANNSGQEALTAALARLSEANLEGSKLIANETRRAQRPSNEVVPMRSVFNRRGQLLGDEATGPKKPHLKCLMMIPWLVEWESVTREEAELLNLLEKGDYMLKRVDNSKVRVTVTMEFNTQGDRPTRLLLNHDTAFNNDNFRLIPDLVSMLRQILKQHDPSIAMLAAAVLSDEEEEAMIEAGMLSVSA